ncbi:unnamed protein product [Amoebophrya sp. A120]|nr:unnamed protein product [Amoebophrya sp. A120]|eukprot:GSA120T00022648001.1
MASVRGDILPSNQTNHSRHPEEDKRASRTSWRPSPSGGSRSFRNVPTPARLLQQQQEHDLQRPVGTSASTLPSYPESYGRPPDPPGSSARNCVVPEEQERETRQRSIFVNSCTRSEAGRERGVLAVAESPLSPSALYCHGGVQQLSWQKNPNAAEDRLDDIGVAAGDELQDLQIINPNHTTTRRTGTGRSCASRENYSQENQEDTGRAIAGCNTDELLSLEGAIDTPVVEQEDQRDESTMTELYYPDLSDDNWLLIFAFLRPDELGGIVPPVCKRFLELAYAPHLWVDCVRITYNRVIPRKDQNTAKGELEKIITQNFFQNFVQQHDEHLPKSAECVFSHIVRSWFYTSKCSERQTLLVEAPLPDADGMAHATVRYLCHPFLHDNHVMKVALVADRRNVVFIFRRVPFLLSTLLKEQATKELRAAQLQRLHKETVPAHQSCIVEATEVGGGAAPAAVVEEIEVLVRDRDDDGDGEEGQSENHVLQRVQTHLPNNHAVPDVEQQNMVMDEDHVQLGAGAAGALEVVPERLRVHHIDLAAREQELQTERNLLPQENVVVWDFAPGEHHRGDEQDDTLEAMDTDMQVDLLPSRIAAPASSASHVDHPQHPPLLLPSMAGSSSSSSSSSSSDSFPATTTTAGGGGGLLKRGSAASRAAARGKANHNAGVDASGPAADAGGAASARSSSSSSSSLFLKLNTLSNSSTVSTAAPNTSIPPGDQGTSEGGLLVSSNTTSCTSSTTSSSGEVPLAAASSSSSSSKMPPPNKCGEATTAPTALAQTANNTGVNIADPDPRLAAEQAAARNKARDWVVSSNPAAAPATAHDLPRHQGGSGALLAPGSAGGAAGGGAETSSLSSSSSSSQQAKNTVGRDLRCHDKQRQAAARGYDFQRNVHLEDDVEQQAAEPGPEDVNNARKHGLTPRTIKVMMWDVLLLLHRLHSTGNGHGNLDASKVVLDETTGRPIELLDFFFGYGIQEKPSEKLSHDRENLGISYVKKPPEALLLPSQGEPGATAPVERATRTPADAEVQVRGPPASTLMERANKTAGVTVDAAASSSGSSTTSGAETTANPKDTVPKGTCFHMNSAITGTSASASSTARPPPSRSPSRPLFDSDLWQCGLLLGTLCMNKIGCSWVSHWLPQNLGSLVLDSEVSWVYQLFGLLGTPIEWDVVRGRDFPFWRPCKLFSFRDEELALPRKQLRARYNAEQVRFLANIGGEKGVRLLRALLTMDPKKRMQIQEALAHEYFDAIRGDVDPENIWKKYNASPADTCWSGRNARNYAIATAGAPYHNDAGGGALVPLVPQDPASNTAVIYSQATLQNYYMQPNPAWLPSERLDAVPQWRTRQSFWAAHAKLRDFERFSPDLPMDFKRPFAPPRTRARSLSAKSSTSCEEDTTFRSKGSSTGTTKSCSSRAVVPGGGVKHGCRGKEESPLFKEDEQEFDYYGVAARKYLFETERLFLKEKMVMYENQKDITVEMRSVLVDWLIEVHHKFKFEWISTLFLAIQILDRFLNHHALQSRKKLQLVGLACLLIASKVEETRPAIVDELGFICEHTYTEDNIRQMEFDVLATLLKYGYVLRAPTAVSFLQIFKEEQQEELLTVRNLRPSVEQQRKLTSSPNKNYLLPEDEDIDLLTNNEQEPAEVVSLAPASGDESDGLQKQRISTTSLPRTATGRPVATSRSSRTVPVWAEFYLPSATPKKDRLLVSISRTGFVDMLSKPQDNIKVDSQGLALFVLRNLIASYLLELTILEVDYLLELPSLLAHAVLHCAEVLVRQIQHHDGEYTGPANASAILDQLEFPQDAHSRSLVRNLYQLASVPPKEFVPRNREGQPIRQPTEMCAVHKKYSLPQFAQVSLYFWRRKEEHLENGNLADDENEHDAAGDDLGEPAALVDQDEQDDEQEVGPMAGRGAGIIIIDEEEVGDEDEEDDDDDEDLSESDFEQVGDEHEDADMEQQGDEVEDENGQTTDEGIAAPAQDERHNHSTINNGPRENDQELLANQSNAAAAGTGDHNHVNRAGWGSSVELQPQGDVEDHHELHHVGVSNPQRTRVGQQEHDEDTKKDDVCVGGTGPGLAAQHHTGNAKEQDVEMQGQSTTGPAAALQPQDGTSRGKNSEDVGGSVSSSSTSARESTTRQSASVVPPTAAAMLLGRESEQEQARQSLLSAVLGTNENSALRAPDGTDSSNHNENTEMTGGEQDEPAAPARGRVNNLTRDLLALQRKSCWPVEVELDPLSGKVSDRCLRQVIMPYLDREKPKFLLTDFYDFDGIIKNCPREPSIDDEAGGAVVSRVNIDGCVVAVPARKNQTTTTSSVVSGEVKSDVILSGGNASTGPGQSEARPTRETTGVEEKENT